MFKVEKEKICLSKELILSKVHPYELFKYYCTRFVEPGKAFCSELREDRSPSCSIYYNEKTGGTYYIDFATGDKLDIFGYLMKKFSCNFYESLLIINNDFQLHEQVEYIKPSIDLLGFEERPRRKIRVKIRSWEPRDEEYWYDKYFIKLSTLKKYNIYPLEYYSIWTNTNIQYDFQCNSSLVYGYYYGKDSSENEMWKIYKPFGKKGVDKWTMNIDHTVISGIDQLPWIDNHVIISSSLKDQLVWYELGYNAVSPQSEMMMNREIIKSLIYRFKQVYVFYDNDETGRRESNKLVQSFSEIKNISLSEYKNVSDYLESTGDLEELKKIVYRLLI